MHFLCFDFISSTNEWQISAAGMAVTVLPLFTLKGKERRKRRLSGGENKRKNKFEAVGKIVILFEYSN